MKSMRTFLVAGAFCAVSVGGFLAGRAGAQQVLPIEAPTPFVFPATWGVFKTAIVTESGAFMYFFEAGDGTLRRVELWNGGNELGRIHVTTRPGAGAQRGVPGPLR